MTIETISDQSIPQTQPDLKSFMSLVASQEEKTRIYVMLELLKMQNLEFITEYPNFSYTKAMTKFATWRTSVQEVFNLSAPETDVIVDSMTREFMKKNVSHKRRRSHEIVNALRGDDASSNVLDHEHKGLRRFLGLR
jgi:hypothetical protein